MNGITVERSLRACAAAAGARRLAARALEEILESSVFTPDLWQSLDDLDTCVSATVRAAAEFATERQLDEPSWEVALSTLARINLHLWAGDSATSLAEELMLMDMLEETVIELFAARTREPGAGDALGAELNWLDVGDASVDELVSATQLLTGADSALAVHVLVGVAIRAMTEIG